MNDLTEFLLARIAEDEQGERAWVDVGDGKHVPGSLTAPTPRMLAECKAKRGLLEVIADDLADDADDRTAQYMIRLLALPYSDHPDFREEWKVT